MEKALLRLIGIKKDKVLTGPERLEIEIINYCNINCLTCWFFSPLGSFYKEKPWKMELEVFKRIINEAKILGVESICIPGIGEPTLHPNLPEMILETKKARLPLHIATNLTVTSKRILKSLCLCDRIDITLLAPTKELYKELQSPSCPEYFDQVLENITYLKSSQNPNKKQKIYIMFILNKLNFKYFKDILELAKKLNLDGIEIQPFDTTPFNKNLSLDYSEIKSFIKEKNKLKKKYPFIEDTFFEEYYKNKFENQKLKRCYMGYFTLLVGIKGKVKVGCFSPQSPSAGNIYKRSLTEIWYSPKAQEIRNEYKYNLDKIHKSESHCPFLTRNRKISKIIQFF